MKKFFSFLFIPAFLIVAAGCQHSVQKSIVYPANDEVLRYDLPYDLTYLRVLEAIDSLSGWQLDTTEKEKGAITIRNLDWVRLDDSDRRYMTFLVKNAGPRETTVEIAPESRHILGGADMLKKIQQYVSREI